MKRFLTIITVFLYLTCFPQDIKKVEIQELKDENGKITKLIYYDVKEGKTLKEIQISELDPYADVKYPKKSSRFGIGFDLSKENNAVLYEEFLSNSNYPDSLISKLNFDFAFEHVYVGKFREFRFIDYELVFFNENECPIGLNNSVIVLNPQGNVVGSILNQNLGFESGVITNEGRFLAYRFVTPDDIFCPSTFPSTSTTGIIYDLERNEQIFKVQSNADFGVNFPTMKSNFNYIVFRYNMKGRYQYNIFFPDKRIVYKRIFTREEQKKLIGFKENGILFGDQKNNNVETFDATFIKESF